MPRFLASLRFEGMHKLSKYSSDSRISFLQKKLDWAIWPCLFKYLLKIQAPNPSQLFGSCVNTRDVSEFLATWLAKRMVV